MVMQSSPTVSPALCLSPPRPTVRSWRSRPPASSTARATALIRNAVVLVENGTIRGVGREPRHPRRRRGDRSRRRDAPARPDRRPHPPDRRVRRQLGRRALVENLRRTVPESAIRATDYARRTLDGRLHHRARRRRGATASTSACATRSPTGIVPGPAHAGRGATRSARAAATATRPAFPTRRFGDGDRHRATASPAAPTASATPSASRSSTAPT